MSSLVGSSRGSYVAINSDRDSDNEENPIVRHERSTSYLTSDDSETGISVLSDNKRLKRHEKCCRIITFFVCILLFIMSAGGFTAAALLPKGSTEISTVQDSLLTLLTRLNSYYFDVKVTQKFTSNEVNTSCNVSIALCSNLETHTKVHNGTGLSHKVIGYSNEQLTELNAFSYLLSGSLIDLDVNITSSRSAFNDPIFLYVFTDLTSYQSFGKLQSKPENYFKRFNVSSLPNHTTRITLPVTNTGFYFYGLSLPNGMDFNYSYNLKQFFYNLTNNDARCELTPQAMSCTLHFDSSLFSDEQCILCYCTGGIKESFYMIETDLIRKPITSLSASLLTLMVVMLIVVLSVLSYDAYRRYCDPKFSTWDTCICNKCRK